MTTLKTINYRGGIARFKIPASWVEEYEPQGEGTFYEPGDNTGTLRINVLSFERQVDDSKPNPTAFEILTLTRSVHEIEALPNGNAIARYVTKADEGSEHLRFYKWQICICVTAKRFRIVVFTYTIVDGQELAPAMKDELLLLDQLIVRGEYPMVEGIAGDYINQPAS